jgi:nitrogen fixation NifU-like protein
MTNMNALYQEIIIDHSKHPQNVGSLPMPATHLEGLNPLCGDRLTLYVAINQKTITDIRFKGCGCAISTASASLMTESVKGKSTQEALHLIKEIHACLTQDDWQELSSGVPLGKLVVLKGVKSYPMRVKCATLAWHTLKALIHGDSDSVTTE